MKVLVIILLLFAYTGVYCQSNEEEEWNLDSLEYNPDDFQQDYIFQGSSGFFPLIYDDNTFYYNLYYISGDIYDHSNITQTQQFGQAYNSWIGNFDIAKDSRKIKIKYSLNNEDKYPITDYNEAGIGITLPTFSIFYLKLNTSISWSTSLIADVYEAKQYRKFDNSISNFKEANFINLDELNLGYSANIIIPIYGATVNIGTYLGSFYYLSGGLSGIYNIKSEATQYLQILDNKSNLRYANGTDTLRIFFKDKLDDYNKIRQFIDIGTGLMINAFSYYINFGLNASLPINSLLNNEEWKQLIIKIGLEIGF